MEAPLNTVNEPQTAVIELCSGTIADGREFYAFVEMDVDSYARYQQALQAGTPIDLPSFGKVLHTGWGLTPDADICAHILQNHTDTPAIIEQMAQHGQALQNILRSSPKE